MAFASSLPPSTLIKNKLSEDDGPTRQSKEQYRKAKELEEARKAGTVPAEQDEEGRDINPHIPQFISSAPWYLSMPGCTLKHQRPHPERQIHFATIQEMDELHSRKGIVQGRKAAKFRKGSCENCGSMTHKRKDCFERPRKIGAKFNSVDIAPDEYIVPKMTTDFETKRDRWAGYNPESHREVIEDHEKLEEARKLVRAEQLEKTDEDQAEAEETAAVLDSQDEDKYADDADMPGVKVDADSRTRITVRNLRIREDTAKYLYNLDPNSAYYDPKSRSMRDNPFKSTGKAEDEVPFAGENFVRYTGEVTDVNHAQLFAWEALKRGMDVHTLAEPTKLEALRNEFTDRKTKVESKVKASILEKYGGEEHLANVPPKELLLSQTEHYVEYNRKGSVVKGEERVTVKSRFPEDIYPSNHSSVWGSFWSQGQWGFACCHGMVKNSYCTGQVGISAREATEDEMAQGAEASEKERGSAPLSKVDFLKVKLDDRFNNSQESKKSLVKPVVDSEQGSEISDSKLTPVTLEQTDKNDAGKESSSSESSSSSDDSDEDEEGEPNEPDVMQESRDEEIKSRLARERERNTRQREQKRRKRQRQKASKARRTVQSKKQRLAGEAESQQQSSDSDSSDSDSDSSGSDEKLAGKPADKTDSSSLAKRKEEVLRKLMKRQAADDAKAALKPGEDERALPYNSKYEVRELDDNDMEAYRRRRIHPDDPMAAFM